MFSSLSYAVFFLCFAFKKNNNNKKNSKKGNEQMKRWNEIVN